MLKDKEWLEKVTVAYKMYAYPSLDIERFIKWLYEQYGIEQNNRHDDE